MEAKNNNTAVQKYVDFNWEKSKTSSSLGFAAIDYICYLNDISKILSDKKALEAVEYLKIYSLNSNTFDLAEETKKSDLIRLIIDLLKHFKKNLSDLVKLFKPMLRDESQTFILSFYKYLIELISNWSGSSATFCVTLIEKGAIDVLLDLILDDSLLKKLAEKHIKHIPTVLEIVADYLVFQLIETIRNLSLFEYKFQAEWRKASALDKLLQFSSEIKLNKRLEPLHLAVYMAASYLFGESNAHMLIELRDIVAEISKCMNIIVENVRKGSARFDIYKHGNFLKVTGLIINKNIQCNGYFFSVVEFLDSLYHLSVIDRIKVAIYDTFKISLRILIYDGNFLLKRVFT
jgi:hypothetical protein